MITTKQFSEATRLKMSESAKRRCASAEWLEAQRAKGTPLDMDTFKRLYYEENHTQKEVADILGVSQKVVFGFMRRHGLPARASAKRYQTGADNSSWKGGRRINEQGYVEVYMPEYSHTRQNGYVREHIYIAEKRLGRQLVFYSTGDPRNEVVHHINGNKTDNRPENLLVLTAQEHAKLHHAATKEMADEVLLKRIWELEKGIQFLTTTTKSKYIKQGETS